jgi:dipeptidyl aminopeptidase/acylaminoacyl peptidase
MLAKVLHRQKSILLLEIDSFPCLSSKKQVLEVVGLTSIDNKVFEIFSISDLSLLTLSHNSEFLLVASNKSNVHQVYQVPLENPENWHNLTIGEDRVYIGALSPDDSRFLFAKESGGNEKHDLFITDLQTYETTLLKKLDSIRIFAPKWTLDDQILYDGSSPDHMGIWRYNQDDKSIISLYQSQYMGIMGPVNPNSPLVAYSERRPEVKMATVTKIIDYHSANVVDVIFASETSLNEPMSWNDEGTQLLIYTDAPGEPTLAVWTMKTKEFCYLQATKLGLAIDYWYEAAKWVPGSTDVIYAAKKDGQTRLYREPADAASSPVELSLPAGWISKIETDKHSSRVFIQWSSPANPTQIWEYDLEAGTHQVLADSKPAATMKFSMGGFVRYPTFDEWQIPAFDVSPHENAPQLTGDPIILLIHGGPSWEFSYDWDAMWQIIQSYAAAGFRVFCPNIRGSTGYGRKFLGANIGDLGGDDLKDVLAAREYLLKKYPHTTKIFLTGASYGGFMTFIGMTKHPGLFNAGVAIVGVSDWVADYRLGDGLFKDLNVYLFGGTPEEKPELYFDRSPINFVHQLEDPLLIIHRANDSRCPVEPIYTFTGKAISLGKPVDIYVEQEAGHGFQKLDHFRMQYGKAIEFFVKHAS